MAACSSPRLFPRRDKATGKPLIGVPGNLVRCGRCLGCRMSDAQSWSVRIAHEASLHSESSFITLTYDDAHLPDPPSVSKRDFQLFMKRLREGLGRPVRFFGCGEYGGAQKRPHYHLILFGCAFLEDRVVWRRTATGHYQYRSPTLERFWTFGLCEFGSVTPQSGGYVARYALKKSLDPDSFVRLDARTGEFYNVEPEFLLMSRRPGIGSGWWDRFASDVFPSDFIVLDGKKVPVPRYYTRKLEESESDRVFSSRSLAVSAKRKARARSDPNMTTARRLVRDELAHLRVRRLKRELEE